MSVNRTNEWAYQAGIATGTLMSIDKELETLRKKIAETLEEIHTSLNKIKDSEEPTE